MINTRRLTDAFMHYVTIDSESFKEDKFHDHMKKDLIRLGFEIIPDQTGQLIGSTSNNLIARRKGDIEGDILGLCAHLDTVKPGQNIHPIIRDQVIYSQGNTILGADDKAGIAIIIEIIRSALENKLPLGPIEIFFSIAEEEGIKGSRYLKEGLLKADDYYILDGIGHPGQVVIGGPANNNICAEIIGKPAHAGLAPEDGINAIEVVSRAVSSMNLGRISPMTTANLGQIIGGEALNIVCPSIRILGEVRSHSDRELSKQTKHMYDCLQEACNTFGAKLNWQVDRAYPSFKLEDDNDFLAYTKDMIMDLGLEYQASIGGGGSDANNLSQHGISGIILGIGIKDCHTTKESIAIKTLEEAAKMSLQLLVQYWKKKL